LSSFPKSTQNIFIHSYVCIPRTHFYFSKVKRRKTNVHMFKKFLQYSSMTVFVRCLSLWCLIYDYLTNDGGPRRMTVFCWIPHFYSTILPVSLGHMLTHKYDVYSLNLKPRYKYYCVWSKAQWVKKICLIDLLMHASTHRNFISFSPITAQKI